MSGHLTSAFGWQSGITRSTAAPFTISGDLDMDGNCIFSGAGSVIICDDLIVQGTTILQDTLAVTGASTLSSTLDVTGASTLLSTLDVTGASTLLSTLDVTGASTLLSTLDVTGTTILRDTLTMTPRIQIESTNSNIGIGSSTTLSSLSSGTKNLCFGEGAGSSLTTQIGAICLGANSSVGSSGGISIGDASFSDNRGVSIGASSNSFDTSVSCGWFSSASNGSVSLGDSCSTSGINSVTISGLGLTNSQNYSVLIGSGTSTVTGVESVCCGYNCASAIRALSAGSGAQSTGDSSVALGRDTVASGVSATACGSLASSTNNQASAYGREADASGIRGTALGFQSDSTGSSSFAGAYSAQALSNSSVAIGDRSVSGTSIGTGQSNISIGALANSQLFHSIAIGQNSQALSLESTACGYLSLADADYACAYGSGADAGGSNSCAIAKNSNASGASALSAGVNSVSSASNAIAIGASSSCVQSSSVSVGLSANCFASSLGCAIGPNTSCSGQGGFAGAYLANAAAFGAVSLGRQSDATGSQSCALGYLSQALATNAVALGPSVTNSVANTVKMAPSDHVFIDSALKLPTGEAITSTKLFRVTNVTGTPTSTPDEGSLAYDSTGNILYYYNGSWQAVTAAAGNTLASTLATGNITGGTDIDITSGDVINFLGTPGVQITASGNDVKIGNSNTDQSSEANVIVGYTNAVTDAASFNPSDNVLVGNNLTVNDTDSNILLGSRITAEGDGNFLAGSRLPNINGNSIFFQSAGETETAKRILNRVDGTRGTCVDSIVMGQDIFQIPSGETITGFNNSIIMGNNINPESTTNNDTEAVDDSVVIGTNITFLDTVASFQDVVALGNMDNVDVSAGSSFWVGHMRSTAASANMNWSSTTREIILATSDERIKENIHDSTFDSSSVLNLNIRDFTMKPGHENVKGEFPLHRGLIAQEAYAVDPLYATGKPDDEELMGINNDQIVFSLLEEVKKLRRELDELKSK